MTNENAELIQRASEIKSDPYDGTVTLVETSFFDELIEALEAQPADVLQHLRDGGKIVSDKFGGWTIDKHMRVSLDELLNGDWQPCTPPPAHGTRSWALSLEDGIKYHETDWAKSLYLYNENGVVMHCDGTPFGDPNLSGCGENGWSLYVEPREPGWYSVQILDGEKTLVAEYWDGNHWCADDDLVDDSYYHWIGKIRIELETPPTHRR